jgi:TonB family protein
MIYYRVAASVAVLMIISSVYIVLDRNKPANVLSVVLEIPVAPAINGEPAPDVADNEPVNQITEPTRATINKRPPENEESKESRQPTVSDIELSRQETVTGKSVASETERFAQKEEVAPFASIQEDSKTIIPSSSISSIDSKAGVSLKSKKSDEEIIADYTPPAPENTIDSFNIYIENNIRTPEDLQSGQTVVVTLTFRVRETGKIDNIKIISSPGKAYSDEAMRLIKEGPVWKPARQEGEYIEDKVTLKITFR